MTTLLTGGTRSREVLDDDVDLARDRVLVTRAQAGDRSAFDDLYARYYRRLHRFCLRRLHDGYEAEDVAQEAFARAWRALPNFAGDRRFYPWLSVIAAHLCTDVLRRRSRSTPVAEFHQGNIISNEDCGEDLMIAAVDSDMVARAFQRLSDRHQRILNLREGSGWSYQRIADHEGVGITAIETLLWRARQALKREFAAIAGTEGRTAAWIGGILSLATLRRLLRFPVHSARRLADLGQGASTIAVGSAAAATAMVVAATLSGAPLATPSHGSLPPSLSSTASHSGGSGNGPGSPLLGGSGPGGGGGSPVTPAAGGTSGAGNGLPGATGGVVNSTSSTAGNALQHASSGLGGVVGNLSGSGSGSSGLGGVIDNTLPNLLGSGGSGGPLSPVLNGADDPGSSLPGALGSALNGATQSVSGTLGTVTGVTSDLPVVGGGTTGGGSPTGGNGSGSSTSAGPTSGGTSGVSSAVGGAATTVTTIPCAVTGVVETLTGSGSTCGG